MRPLSRPEVHGGPEQFKTYQVVSPLGSHWRKATCQEIECRNWSNGFQVPVDTATVLGAKQANYIRMHSGRTYTALANGDTILFRFPAGTECFTEHRVPLERPALFVIRDGDHRGNPRGTRPQQVSASEWVGRFADHTDQIKKEHGNG